MVVENWKKKYDFVQRFFLVQFECMMAILSNNTELLINKNQLTNMHIIRNLMEFHNRWKTIKFDGFGFFLETLGELLIFDKARYSGSYTFDSIDETNGVYCSSNGGPYA